MTNLPVDGLDEFFDFARLERDNRVRGECQDQLSPAGTHSSHGWDSAMDWQPSTPHRLGVCIESTLNPLYDASLSIPSHLRLHSPLPLSERSGALQSQPCRADAMVAHRGLAFSTDLSSCAEGFQTLQAAPALDPSANPSAPTADRATPRPAPAAQATRSGTITRKPASAKRKGPSTRIPLEAKQMLEEEFASNPYPCSWEIDIIAHQANLDVKRVRNWFNNTRARKKPSDDSEATLPDPNASTCSLASKLSSDSLSALNKQTNESIQPPQPPLAVYLAQSYEEEAVNFSALQAAIDTGELSDGGDFQIDTSSSSKMGRSGSVVTSQTSSDGTAPTIYSSGSNMSSFGRDRRRGRRRMAWKTSPHTRTRFNGLNDAGVLQDDLPFFCTFCPRAFKTKYEWIRHEDSVHALRTTWICCDTRNTALLSCPFCGQLRPDEYHMAGHKFQQCKNKPVSQRTFYRRDHFIQHLHHVHFGNVKHPSARLGCQARIMDSEGQNFGCKDLAIKWRRFGAPIKANDPMLHCGFCGKTSRDWSERCEHVAEHMYAGEQDRSSWWPERLENHLENLCLPEAVGPYRCRYCAKVFANSDAMNKHSHCRVWSCRFLTRFDDVAAENAGPPLCPQFPSPKAHHCYLCGAGYRSFHVEHAEHYHRYRNCNQRLYASEEEFLDHLHQSHGAAHPQLLRGNSILEQNYSRNKGASFEPVQFGELLEGCRVVTPRASFVDPVVEECPLSLGPTAEHAKQQLQAMTPPRRRTPDQGAATDLRLSRVGRQRSDSTESRPTPSGPRFFRLNPLVPFLRSRIYYLRSAIPDSLFPDGKAVLDEMEKSHVASLVMSSGLLGMAGVRFPVHMKRDGAKGPIEFTLDEVDDDW